MLLIKYVSIGNRVSLSTSTQIPGEPDGPSIKTALPGPKTKQLLGELNKLQVSSSNKS